MILFSPSYLPSYNGAYEGRYSIIKHLDHDLAYSYGRPGRWTPDDLKDARLLANRRITDREQTRSPKQRFSERQTIFECEGERDQFAAAICAACTLRLTQLKAATGKQQRSITADALERQAITETPQKIDTLSIRSSQVRPPNQDS